LVVVVIVESLSHVDKHKPNITGTRKNR